MLLFILRSSPTHCSFRCRRLACRPNKGPSDDYTPCWAAKELGKFVRCDMGRSDRATYYVFAEKMYAETPIRHDAT